MAILKGLKDIGRYLGCSPATVLRRHDAWRNSGDVALSLPMTPMATGKGRGITWITETDLLLLWLKNLSRHSAIERVNRVKKAPRGISVKMGGSNGRKSQGEAAPK